MKINSPARNLVILLSTLATSSCGLDHRNSQFVSLGGGSSAATASCVPVASSSGQKSKANLGTIRGRTADAQNNNASGVNVVLRADSGKADRKSSLLGSAVSDSNGNYCFSDVPIQMDSGGSMAVQADCSLGADGVSSKNCGGQGSSIQFDSKNNANPPTIIVGDVGGGKTPAGGDVGGSKPAGGGDVGGLKPPSGDVGGIKPIGDVGGIKPIGDVGGVKPVDSGTCKELSSGGGAGSSAGASSSSSSSSSAGSTSSSSGLDGNTSHSSTCAYASGAGAQASADANGNATGSGSGPANTTSQSGAVSSGNPESATGSADAAPTSVSANTAGTPGGTAAASANSPAGSQTSKH